MGAPACRCRRLHRARLAQWWSFAVHLFARVRSRVGSAASFCNLTARVTLSEPQWLGNASIEYTARHAVAGLGLEQGGLFALLAPIAVRVAREARIVVPVVVRHFAAQPRRAAELLVFRLQLDLCDHQVGVITLELVHFPL